MGTLKVKVWHTIIRSKYILRAHKNNNDENEKNILKAKKLMNQNMSIIYQFHSNICATQSNIIHQSVTCHFPHSIVEGDATTIARRSENLSARC